MDAGSMGGHRVASTSRARRPTIVDVARVAAVSHATVSRYLNKRSYVSQASATAIESAITETGYVPNRTARSLVNDRSHTVAFIVRERPDLFFADPNLSAMAIGANAALSAAGFQMLMLIVESDESAIRIIDLVRGGFVDGALLIAMEADDPVATALSTSATPVVTASSPLPDGSAPSVDTDNVGGSAEVTRMLVQAGRRRIAEIHGPPDAPASALRHRGFVEAMADLYDDRLVIPVQEWSLRAGFSAMTKLLTSTIPFDAVVAASDVLAAGALEALHARGLKVPDDVAIVGFDDSPWATRTIPELSTVHQDSHALGTRLAEVLLRSIDGEDLRGHHEVVPHRIIWRESAGPLLADGACPHP